jgi:hypothetical protein
MRYAANPACRATQQLVRRHPRRDRGCAIVSDGIVAAALLLVLAGTMMFDRARPGVSGTGESKRYHVSIVLPAGMRFAGNAPGRFELSPDGRRIAFTASDASGRQMLWVRALDSNAPQPLAGTEGAGFPFWSPDSRSLGFTCGRVAEEDRCSRRHPHHARRNVGLPLAGASSVRPVPGTRTM